MFTAVSVVPYHRGALIPCNADMDVHMSRSRSRPVCRLEEAAPKSHTLKSATATQQPSLR